MWLVGGLLWLLCVFGCCRASLPIPADQELLTELLGRRWRFESENNNNHSIDLAGHRLKISSHEAVSEEDDDTLFNIIPGLCGAGISLQSNRYPDHFVRHQNFKVWMHVYQKNDANFAYDACWLPRKGLSDKMHISLESMNSPKHFIRHSNRFLWLHKEQASVSYEQDATFIRHKLSDRTTSSSWVLLYGNNNAQTTGHYTFTQALGIEASPITLSQSFPETSSTWSGTRIQNNNNLEITLGRILRNMYIDSGVSSAARVSEKAFRVWSATCESPGCETQHVDLIEGRPLYVWQWHLYCDTADGTRIDAYTNIFAQTSSLHIEPNNL